MVYKIYLTNIYKNMEKIYIAKEDSWFKTNTEAKLIEYIHNIGAEKFGNFEGIYVVRDTPYDTYWRNKGHEIGDEVLMSEICSYDEFEIKTKLPDEVTINKIAFDFAETQLKQILSAYPNADVDVDGIKLSFKAGFKTGFKYLDDLKIIED